MLCSGECCSGTIFREELDRSSLTRELQTFSYAPTFKSLAMSGSAHVCVADKTLISKLFTLISFLV